MSTNGSWSERRPNAASLRSSPVLKSFSILAFCVAALASLLPPAAAQGLVDWGAVLASETDPRITISPAECPPGPAGTLPGICIRFNGPEATGAPNGYVTPAAIRYGDLSGDSSAKAVIPVLASGSEGAIGFLIYQMAAPNPWLVAAQGGLYQAEVTIENTTLVVRQPIFAPSDGAFSLSAMTTTTYRFEESTLVPLAQNTANVAIRYTDWRAAFTVDPWITTGAEHCPGMPQAAADQGAFCVLVAPFGSDPPSATQDPDAPVISGYILGTPLVGDIGGEDIEDAIIPIQSGGPAGTVGLLVYRPAESGPRLVAALATYQGVITLIQAGTVLLVTTPVINDPVGPTRFRQATYVLNGDVLVLTSVGGFGAG